MSGKDTMVVSSGDDQKKVVPPWLRLIASIKLYDLCKTHTSKECNFYCTVCMVALCKECKRQHDLSKHEIIQAYKVSKMGASFKMEALEPSWDISDISPYFCNGPVALICKRGDGIARYCFQSDAAKCESCQYRLNSPSAKYCSLECKVEAVMKMNEGGSIKDEAKRKVETMPEGSTSKRPRKQRSP